MFSGPADQVLLISKSNYGKLIEHHFEHVDSINTHAVQYVGQPGFEGGRRLVDFEPLS